MSIGPFAKRVGLTASALRFYDDAGLLRPEQIDPRTNYRFYSESQVARASQLRGLREIGMPLSMIGDFFDATPTEAGELIDEQVAKVAADAGAVQHAAAMLKASLVDEVGLRLGVLPGPVLAAAVDQVLATTVDEPEFPVLAGVRLESDPDAITLTATDRYRLATRTLVPTRASAVSWAGTVAGDDLVATMSRLRRSPTVTMTAAEHAVAFGLADGTTVHCRLLTAAFPDYKSLIASLAEVTHRVTIPAQQFLKALEQAPSRIGLRISDGQPSLVLPEAVVALDGASAGADLTVWFELTTLYPAVSHALGVEVMLDLRGPDQPATVRSADDGDLTALVMPCRADPS